MKFRKQMKEDDVGIWIDPDRLPMKVKDGMIGYCEARLGMSRNPPQKNKNVYVRGYKDGKQHGT